MAGNTPAKAPATAQPQGARAAFIGSARERDRALPRKAASAERGLDRVRLNTA